jgi:hypothetical protein
LSRKEENKRKEKNKESTTLRSLRPNLALRMIFFFFFNFIKKIKKLKVYVGVAHILSVVLFQILKTMCFDI